eukprot:TRINITY_DN8103_c0_g1_i1.p1 TRINITY_DN8103_c0_g1~~TRINITY_DN8103_c0_g1_i1.p1  ORF type:complete len:814 (+),score=169.96 TRINITY_DN8103_c0_g1_i1:3-2444(+)
MEESKEKREGMATTSTSSGSTGGLVAAPMSRSASSSPMIMSRPVSPDLNQMSSPPPLFMIDKKNGPKSASRVFVVVKKLPLTIVPNSKGAELVWEKLDPIAGAVESLSKEGKFQFHWVGHMSVDPNSPNMSAFAPDQLLEAANLHPVTELSSHTRTSWEKFCKTVISPLLNSQFGAGTASFDYDLWKEYKKVQKEYARVISSVIKDENDMIWIHDYHLMSLPFYIRKSDNKAHVNRIGYFSHAPFPTSELLRLLPIRDKLLRRVLDANKIGFQTYHDSRHFISCCTRLLESVDATPERIIYSGHKVSVAIYPTGIMPSVLETVMESREFKQKFEELTTMFNGKKILVARDRLDPIKGVPQKLVAFEQFLKCFPNWKGKVVLFQICLPPREERRSEVIQKLTSHINELVGTINGSHSTADFTPIHYLNKDISINEMCALYAVADAGFIIPLRDGMNLSSHEFTICQKTKQNPLILSEFAGSAQSLGGAILVNPWDQEGVITAINDALMMSPQEKKVKHDYNYQYVKEHTADTWAKNFLTDLSYTTVFTALPILNEKNVLDAYSKSSKRLFILSISERDNLTAFGKVLEALTKDTNNFVYVLDTEKDTLERKLGELEVGMYCDGDLMFKPHPRCKQLTSSNHGAMTADGWIDLKEGVDYTWYESVLPILQDYTDRTPGSEIEQDENKMHLVWNYKNAAVRDHASFQGMELVVHLQNVLSRFPVEVRQNEDRIELIWQGVDKGAIARRIVKIHQNCDFFLCFGKDQSDEPIFSRGLSGMEEKVKVFTCAAGKRESAASSYLPDYQDVLRLLRKLTQ